MIDTEHMDRRTPSSAESTGDVPATATDLLISTYTARGAQAGAEAGAAGVGLVRTEMMFLGRLDEPSVADQAAAYRSLLATFVGKPVVFRVWDVGSDKVLPFATAASAPNPALGERGIRYLRRAPGLLDRQLSAIVEAAAASAAVPTAMAPMVAVPEEAAWFADRCRRNGVVRIGAMIEVPSAVLMASEVMATVDFVSVGTNDLLQYALATDRSAAGSLAELADPWQPALLRLLTLVVEAARLSGHPVGVCGEAASDPVFAAVLAGLGVTSLSVQPKSLTAVRATLEAAGTEGCVQAYAGAAAAADNRAARVAASAAVAGVG